MDLTNVSYNIILFHVIFLVANRRIKFIDKYIGFEYLLRNINTKLRLIHTFFE